MSLLDRLQRARGLFAAFGPLDAVVEDVTLFAAEPAFARVRPPRAGA